MKVLFVMRSTVYVRNFESTLRSLAERGHEVHVVARPHLPESDALIARLCAENPAITHTHPPVLPFSAWSLLGREVRRALDYLRYLQPEYENAPKLRYRAWRNAPPFVLEALKRPWVAKDAGRSLLARMLRWCDRAVPTHPAMDAFIASHAPDLVLVTPLVEPGSPQSEYLRSARAGGVPTGLCVYSWDNLTNKGLIHDRLDVVTVWNEAMKREAIELHRVAPERIVVTGAAAYDHWFGWRPRFTREEFCARVGLRADRPYLLYLCSSVFIARNEVEFVRRWVSEIRAASPALRDAGVLVRPHPQNTDQWKTEEFLGERVVVWPRAGANPMDADSRSDYFDSIYHSAAVVGVNTTAQIESAIVGRGVYTLLAPEFRDTQEGTLHFHHLRAGVTIGATLAEHVAQLEAAIHGETDLARCRQFVESFVRPYGYDEPATPRLVAALEQTGAQARRRRDRGPWWVPLVRPMLSRAAVRLARSEEGRRQKAARQERLKQERHRERTRQREKAQAARAQTIAEREQKRLLHEQNRQAERRAREAFEARAYDNYRHVRDWAARMGDGGRGSIAALAPLWEADARAIASLRQLAEPISGVRAADYADRSVPLAPRLKRTIGFLRKYAGADLLVYEPAELGGFGFNEQGSLYNEDTARFFTALVALQDAAVLQAIRGNRHGRSIVWEIGGGWGGFAYQFKRVCPNVTYVISAAPDLFLLSATYLTSLFPDAHCRFYDPARPDALWQDWERADFVFVPEGALASVTPPRLDLTVDVGALPRMDPQRACVQVHHSFESGSRFFYTLLNGKTDHVSTIERYYWPHPVPPRRDPKLAAAGESGDPDWNHLVGWRRLRVPAPLPANTDL